MQLGIVKLMTMGHSDEVIARHIEQSRSTVRRHIGAVAALVGDPPGRFALGVALERRGWIPRKKETDA
jgi:hypothetical protein